MSVVRTCFDFKLLTAHERTGKFISSTGQSYNNALTPEIPIWLT